MNCIKCGTIVNEGDKFCSKCGAVVEVKPTSCPQCGETLTLEARFCPKCGKVIGDALAGARSGASLNYASFWLRVGAFMLDNIILSIVSVPILIFVTLRTLGVLPSFDPTELLLMQDYGLRQYGMWILLYYFVPSVIRCLYFVICHTYGQTLGKKMAGIKVIRNGGERPGFGRALLRETIGRFCAAVVFCLGYLWVAWDKNKQGWQDKIAGTFVVHS